uniref:TF-B3 domain-containing protein n=1 Tax=Arundo donax TaxID=35708 RepID=A0A0A8XSY4_ARUDO
MGQMGDGDDGGGGHPHSNPNQYHYQALLAAVQNPNQTLHHPFPLPFPFPAGPGADASTFNVAAPHSQTPRGFADWSASNSAFTSLAAQPPPVASNAAFRYNLSQSYALWTHYMVNKNVPYSYPAPYEEHAPPLRHSHSQDKDSGSAPGLGVESFTTMSLGPHIYSHMPPMEGSISAKEAENSEDLPTVVRSSDEMETRNSEVHCETVGTLPDSKQGHESCATKFNSGEYQVILRKELTKSDVANVGRIVLPKKDAEASLPPLVQGDPLILQMDDMVLPITWKFKYRFWPNNKSRMYILEAAGEFVKTHGLQAGDALIIYKNSEPGKFIIRGEKAVQQTTNP